MEEKRSLRFISIDLEEKFSFSLSLSLLRKFTAGRVNEARFYSSISGLFAVRRRTLISGPNWACRSDCVRDSIIQGGKDTTQRGPWRWRSEGHVVWLRVSCSPVSVFGNGNSMCKYRVSRCNDPARACVRKRVHTFAA